VFCPFILFLLAIVLSVLLRFTDSDYPLWYLLTLLDLSCYTERVVSDTCQTCIKTSPLGQWTN